MRTRSSEASSRWTGFPIQCECSDDIAMSGKLDNPQKPTAVVCDCGISFPIETR